MTALAQKRVTFSVNMAKLVLWLNEQAGESAYVKQVERSKIEADANAAKGSGISNSLHLLGLAVDVVILVYDEYRPDLEVYQPAGDFWKSLHPLNRWGGDFRPEPDADHFSMEHNGVK